jgi:hypothetical protein
MTDSSKFQMTCMTCMYVSSKTQVDYKLCLTPRQIEHLSCGRFTPEQIETTEMGILSALQWRVNPPTAISFVQNLLELVPSYRLPERDSMLEVVETQIELAMSDGAFVTAKASSLGFAALMNYLERVLGRGKMTYYYYIFTHALGCEDRDTFKSTSDKLRKQLHSLVVESLGSDDELASSDPEGIPPPPPPKTQEEESPTTVITRKFV